MYVTESGIITDCSDKHPKKVHSPISVMELGNVNDLSDEQLTKDLIPISVTESGIVMDCSDEHPKKAEFPIAVTEFGIEIYSEWFRQEINLPDLSIRRLSMSLNEISDNNISESLGQLEKAPSPIAVTESGIFTDLSDEHPWKASSPITVTESGIFTDLSDEHPWKASFPIAVTESGITTDLSDEHP